MHREITQQGKLCLSIYLFYHFIVLFQQGNCIGFLDILITALAASLASYFLFTHLYRDSSIVVRALTIFFVVISILQPYNSTQLYTTRHLADGSSAWEIFVVTDLDHDSKTADGKKWQSLAKRGTLKYENLYVIHSNC